MGHVRTGTTVTPLQGFLNLLGHEPRAALAGGELALGWLVQPLRGGGRLVNDNYFSPGWGKNCRSTAGAPRRLGGKEAWDAVGPFAQVRSYRVTAPTDRFPGSSEDFVQDFAGHVGEAITTAVVQVSEPLVVDAE